MERTNGGHRPPLQCAATTLNKCSGKNLVNPGLTDYYLGSITAVVNHGLMAKQRMHRLGDLQLRIMQVLWESPAREATVAAVHQALAAHQDLAYTTVATMLRKMEARGLVTHRAEGRSFVYAPNVAAEDVSRSMADHWVDRLFAGSLLEAVNHLLTTREVSADELRQLEKLIAERKRRR